MTRRLSRKAMATAVVLAAGMPVAPALAQLEEIVVTAQKREQSLQDTPIAISAFDDAMIDTRGIQDVADIAGMVPNVQIAVTPNAATGATVAIRGSSTTNPAITWENVVGMYLDGIFLGKNLGSLFDIAQLQRIEVLRGPQGSLYGKNTIGGAINLITRLPGEEFGGTAEVKLGNEGYVRGKLSLDTGAIGKVGEGLGELRANFAFMQAERDGFYENYSADPFGGFNPAVSPASTNEFSDLDSKVFRLDAILQVTDTFSARYAFDTTDRDQKTVLGQLTHVNVPMFAAIGQEGLGQALAAYVIPETERAERIGNDYAGFERSEIQGHSLILEWDLGDMTFKSLSSYRDMDWSDAIDIDGSTMDLFHSGRDIGYDQLSQEFQLLGSTDNLNYVVGLYYFEESADVINPISFFGFNGFGRPTDVNRYGMDNNSIAVFGQVDWTVPSVERLTLSVGLRYTEEEKDQYIVHPETSSGGVTAFSEQDSRSWDNLSGSFTAAYDFTDDVQGYFRIAQGWKSGGFNGEAPVASAFHEGYDPEEVLSYELGLKSRFMDDRVQLNAAYFMNEVTDMQLSIFLEGSSGAASNIANAAEATQSGFEVELAFQATDALRLGVNYGYLDVKYDSFIELGRDVRSEKDFPYSPESTYSVNLDWYLLEADWGALSFHADWNHVDDYVPYTNKSQNVTSMIDARDVVNASLVLDEVQVGGDKTLRFSLWGRNIFDEEYRQNTIPFGFWTVSYWGDPATYGVSARLTF